MSHLHRTPSTPTVGTSLTLSLLSAVCVGGLGAFLISVTALAANTATTTTSPAPVSTVEYSVAEVQPAVQPAPTKAPVEVRTPQRPDPVVPEKAPLVADPKPSPGGPEGCAVGCITSASTGMAHATPLDVELHVQTDTPAEVIVAMMALDQGDDPVGGDPYGASHGLVTDWTITLADLLPLTTYEVAVVAFDQDGGSDTETLTFTTGPGTLDKLVSNGAGTVPTPVEASQMFVVAG